VDNQLIVLGFQGESTAEDMLSVFQDMEEKGILTIEDAVLASRGPGHQVAVKQTQSVTGKYTARGSGIGLLAGLLLGGPVGGLIGGTVVGAIAGAMKDVGIDDKFIEQVSDALGPDSSALFLMGQAEDADQFLEQLRPFKAVVASTTLSEDQEKRLKAALEREE
jgi:uncharacterized membrane protein